MLLPAGRLVLSVLGGLVAVVLLAAALLAWRLSQGPITVSVLSPYLATALTSALQSGSVEIGETVLAWRDDDRAVEIRTRDVTVRDPAGTITAVVPAIDIRLSGAALLRGRIGILAVDITGVAAVIVRRADGSLDFGPDVQAAAAPESANPFADVALRALTRAADGVADRLRRVTIVNADLTLFDEASGAVWEAADAYAVLQREPEALRVNLVAAVPFDGAPRRIAAEGLYRLDTGDADVSITFADLRFAALAERAADWNALRPFDLPLGGKVAFQLSRSGRPSDVSFDLQGGAGKLAVPGLAAPLAVERVAARGAVAPDGQRLKIDAAQVRAGGVEIDATALVDRVADQLQVDAQVRNLPADRVGEFWPPAVGPGGRAWVLQNVRGGTVSDAQFVVRLPLRATLDDRPLPPDGLKLTFNVAGSAVHYLRPMPPLTDVVVKAAMNLAGLDLNVSAGRVGDIPLAGGSVAISGFLDRVQIARIAFNANGPIPSVLGLLDREPLALVRNAGIAASDVAGAARLRTELQLPLLGAVRMADINVAVSGELERVAAALPVDGVALADGRFQLRASKQGLDLRGRGALNGAPLDITWAQDFTGRAAIVSRYTVAGRVDDAARATLPGSAEMRLTGPVQTELNVEEARGGALSIGVRLGLAGAGLEVPALKWSKPAAAPGEFRADLRREAGERWLVRSATLTAADMQATGTAELRGGRLVAARIAPLRYGENDLELTVGRGEDGGFLIEAVGPRADLRPFLSDLTSGPAPDAREDAATPFRLSLRAEAARFGETFVLNRTATRLETGGGRPVTVSMVGQQAGGKPFSFSLTPTPDGRRRTLALSAGDAGGVVDWIGLGHVQGGAMTAAGEIADDQPGAPLTAKLSIVDFRLVEAPVFAKLLSVASLTGLVNVLSGEGLQFQRADLPLTLTGSELRLGPSRAYGAALGITTEGGFDLNSRALSLNGTLVPAYSLNSFLGRIPLIGNLFVGREGEGIFGITYRVGGTTAEPDVVVNPVSLFAPGFLRRLFELPEGSSAERAGPNPNADR